MGVYLRAKGSLTIGDLIFTGSKSRVTCEVTVVFLIIP